MRLGFDVSRISVDSWELRRRRRVSNRRRDRFHNCARGFMADVGRRPAIRNEKILRDFGFKILQFRSNAPDAN